MMPPPPGPSIDCPPTEMSLVESTHRKFSNTQAQSSLPISPQPMMVGA